MNEVIDSIVIQFSKHWMIWFSVYQQFAHKNILVQLVWNDYELTIIDFISNEIMSPYLFYFFVLIFFIV